MRVFDDSMEDKLDNSPAYQHSLLLQIVPLLPLPTSSSSAMLLLQVHCITICFAVKIFTVYNLF